MEVLGQPAHRIGGWLIGFGVVGLLLTAIFVIGWLGSLVALQNVDLDQADGQSLSSGLTNAADLMDSTATALESSTDTIGAVSDTLDDTTVLLNDLAETSGNLAEALDISIFGQHPFSAAAASIADIADELDTFAQHASTLDEQVSALQPDLAAVAEDKSALAKESADVLYHLLVLWASAGITPDDVYAVLKAREGRSGLDEKASRKG